MEEGREGKERKEGEGKKQEKTEEKEGRGEEWVGREEKEMDRSMVKKKTFCWKERKRREVKGR